VSTRLVLNGKKSGLPEIRAAVGSLRERGFELEVRVTWEAGDAVRLVREAADEGVARVIVGGGDGSVNEVANGLMALEAARRPELAILPLGTANDFATACGIPDVASEALTLALTGDAVPVDLAKANDHYFANVASIGFGAAVTAETPVELKNFLGGGAYTIMGLLKALNFRPYPGTLVTPDGEESGEIVVAAVCNGRQAGGGQELAPSAFIDDGLIDIVSLSPFPIAQAKQVAAEIENPSPDGEFARHRRLPWAEIRCEVEIPINLDGEPLAADAIRFEAVPGAIRLVLPAGCPCIGN